MKNFEKKPLLFVGLMAPNMWVITHCFGKNEAEVKGSGRVMWVIMVGK
jgi:hypothetical protein